MVEEKKAYRILYEAELEISFYRFRKPSDKDFIKAIKYDLEKAFSREDCNLTRLHIWSSDVKIKRLSVERIREYPKK